ncbi:hypothetical protein AWB71_05263 [Caballeronia peredens]|nr:hypothetical protein AWB71_05263 [Caballeronia peredens]
MAVFLSGCKDEPKRVLPKTAAIKAEVPRKEPTKWVYDNVVEAGQVEMTRVAVDVSDKSKGGDTLNVVLLRKPNQDVQAVLKMGKAFVCPAAGEPCFVKIRFDGSASEKYSVEAAAGEDGAVFVNRASTLISMIKTAKTAWIDVPVGDGKTETFAIDVGNLDWNY